MVYKDYIKEHKEIQRKDNQRKHNTKEYRKITKK